MLYRFLHILYHSLLFYLLLYLWVAKLFTLPEFGSKRKTVKTAGIVRHEEQ